MASGSRARGQDNAAAGADALALDTGLANPNLAHLPAGDLVVHLYQNDRSGSDFADVALVLARRLTEAEDRIRRADLNAAGLRETIRELEEKVANAEALARDRTVAGKVDDESQAGDHLTAIDVGAAELTGGEIRARDLEVGDNIPSPIPLMTIHAFPDDAVTAAPTLPDELIEDRAVEGVVVDVAVPRSHKVAEAGVVDCRDKVSETITGKMKKEPAASDLFLPLDDLRRSSVPCEVVGSHLPYPHDHMARKRKEPASISLTLLADTHRVTGHKVSEEEEHGEDVAASPHKGSQAEQPARATKKARRQKEKSFYSMMHKTLLEKQNLVQKKEKEAIAKKAAASACKQVHCRCWWSYAPCSP